MKNSFKLVLFLFSLIISNAFACQISDINAFARDIATSYKSRTMEYLDAKYTLKEPIEVIIEHSLLEDEVFEKKKFKDFKSIQEWLTSREMDRLPHREIRKLLSCREGECLYDFYEGILHNTLYLHDIKYSGNNNCAAISVINFYDGD
jgi:hypothetical protein